MKLLVLASSRAAIPCLDFLCAEGRLAALVCPDREHADLHDLKAWASHRGIEPVVLSKEKLETGLHELIGHYDVSLVLSIAFPYKIPGNLLNTPQHGFLNIHFSRLPAYRGPSPVFWQIRNGEKQTGISIHRMDSGWDTGPVLSMLEVPLFPGETTGICTGRLGYLVPGLLKKLLQDDLRADAGIPELPAHYDPRPGIADMSIDWTVQSAAEIENLANACNHNGGGALTAYRSQPLQVIEVSPVGGQGQEGIPGGTVVHADGNGLFVQCADRSLLRLNILKMNEGILSGFRLAAMGMQAGERFEMPGRELYDLKH